MFFAQRFIELFQAILGNMSMKQPGAADNSIPLIEGSLWVAIWHTTWPMFINMCAFALSSFVDTWVAGRLSADAQAAMGIGWQIRYFMMMLTMALEVGTIALVSRYHGAGDRTNTIESVRQALLLAALFGLFSVCVGLPASGPLLHLLGASAAVEQQGCQYLQFSLISTIPSTLLWTSQSILRAVGDAKSSMLTTIVASILIIVLDPLLCLEPLHLGISGIGIAWIISNSLAFAWNILKMRKSILADSLSLQQSFHLSCSVRWFVRFMRIGIPGCIQEIALILGGFGLFYVLSKTSQPAANQAAWGVGWRVEELLVLTPMFAFNTAIAIIVGQNLGARQPERAELATLKITAVGFILNVLLAVCLWFGAPAISGILSTDALVVSSLGDYLRTIAWSEPFFAGWFILCGAMQGAGYTRTPMIATIACLGVIRVGLAWYLTVVVNMGVNGTWLATALTSFLSGVVLFAVFKLGRWKHQVV